MNNTDPNPSSIELTRPAARRVRELPRDLFECAAICLVVAIPLFVLVSVCDLFMVGTARPDAATEKPSQAAVPAAVLTFAVLAARTVALSVARGTRLTFDRRTGAVTAHSGARAIRATVRPDTPIALNRSGDTLTLSIGHGRHQRSLTVHAPPGSAPEASLQAFAAALSSR